MPMFQPQVSGAGLSANSFTGTQTITPAVGSSALVVAGVTQTTSWPVLDLAQTWNAGAVTFTGLRLNITNTASAGGSLLVDFQVGGISAFRIESNRNATFTGEVYATTTGSSGAYYLGNGAAGVWNSGFGMRIKATDYYSWVSGSNATAVPDLVLVRDAANTLAQRNGTAAQAFRVYNTFTDASNGEWGAMRWNSNVLEIGAFANGTGSSRALKVIGAFNSFVELKANSIIEINSSNGGSITVGSTSNVTITGGLSLANSFFSGVETTAPAAPAANGYRIYAEDNGSGKTRLMALFATGAAQQLAIEP